MYSCISREGKLPKTITRPSVVRHEKAGIARQVGYSDRLLAQLSPSGVQSSQVRRLADLHRFTIPNGSEERGVLAVGSIPDAILPCCRDMKTCALYLHKMNIVW